MLKLIILDFDGVIIDNYELHFALSERQINWLTREEHRKLFEWNIHSEREKLKDRNTWFDLKENFNALKKDMVIDLRIKKTIESLSKSYSLWIISSAKEEWTNQCLELNWISKCFKFVYWYETHVLKTEKFKKAFWFMNIPSQESIFITDTLWDIIEANEVGIKTIAVESWYHEVDRLKKGKPYGIISSLTDINTILESLN